MAMRTTMLRWLVPLSLMVILSGCGGGSGPSTSISLSMTEFAFMPNTFTVPAGEAISLKVTNNGAVAHDLMIMKLGHDLTNRDHMDDSTRANAYWEQTLVPSGQTVTTSFRAPSEPGEYQILCGVAGHFEAGMAGKLIVVASP